MFLPHVCIKCTITLFGDGSNGTQLSKFNEVLYPCSVHYSYDTLESHYISVNFSWSLSDQQTCYVFSQFLLAVVGLHFLIFCLEEDRARIDLYVLKPFFSLLGFMLNFLLIYVIFHYATVLVVSM